MHKLIQALFFVGGCLSSRKELAALLTRQSRRQLLTFKNLLGNIDWIHSGEIELSGDTSLLIPGLKKQAQISGHIVTEFQISI